MEKNKKIAASIIPNSQQSGPATSVLARQKFNSLEKWLYSQQTSQMALHEVELGEEIQGRELLRLLLQAHVEGRGDGDVGSSIRVFDSGETLLYSHKRLRDRKVFTVFC